MIFLYCLNGLDCITKAQFVLREIGTELLNIMRMNLQGHVSTIYAGCDADCVIVLSY